MGQLYTLLRDGLALPLEATLGFVDLLAVMLVLAWFAQRYRRKHRPPLSSTQVGSAPAAA